MGGAESVVLALAAAREARDSPAHAYAAHRFTAARENLVRIGLVSHVPDDAIMRRVEDVVQRRRSVDGLQQLVRGRIVFGRSDLGLAAGKIRFSDRTHRGELSRKRGS